MNEKLAYLAGMIDADGCVYMHVRPKKGTLILRVMVYNACEDLMDWLVLHFGGIKRLYKTNDGTNWKPLFSWEIGGESAHQLLQEVKEYMVVKPARAKVAIEAWETRGDFRGVGRWHGGVPAEIVERRQAYVDELHELNSTGRSN